MLADRELVAVIPARSGTKSIPGKNLLEIDGESLLVRAIKLAKSATRVHRVLVTTDDPDMHEIAKVAGAEAPCLRPQSLADDRSRTVDAVKHVLNEANVSKRGYVLLLQVTTPLRTAEDLEKLFDLFERNSSAKAAVSVVEHDEPHPYKLLQYRGPYVEPFLGSDALRPRQELPRVYALNGAFYLTSRETIESEGTFMPEQTVAYEMPEWRSVNLDGPMDLLLLRALLADQGSTVYPSQSWQSG